MSEPSGHEQTYIKLLEQALDIRNEYGSLREGLAKLDGRFENINASLSEIKQDVSEVKRETREAHTKADRALQMSEENKQDIRDMQSNGKWTWGQAIAVIGIIASIGIAVFK